MVLRRYHLGYSPNWKSALPSGSKQWPGLHRSEPARNGLLVFSSDEIDARVGAAARSQPAPDAQGSRQCQPVEVRGACYSACALKLGSGNGVCVAPSARIGVHEVRRAVSPASYAVGERDMLATAFFETLLPVCARELFASLHGFDGGALTVVSGQDILSACPQFRSCPG